MVTLGNLKFGQKFFFAKSRKRQNYSYLGQLRYVSLDTGQIYFSNTGYIHVVPYTDKPVLDWSKGKPKVWFKHWGLPPDYYFTK